MPALTTLDSAKAWLGVSSNADDDLLTNLISQVSAGILSYLQRPDILRRQYTDQFMGSGTPMKMLKNYPVIAVSSVASSYLTIPAGDGRCLGYWLEPGEGIPPGKLQMVHLNGYCFDRQMCKIIYEAGYFIEDEPQLAAASVSVLAPYGSWARDEGVTYADGRVMALATGTPAQGQYAIRGAGQYVFATADANVPILISYSYIPAVLEAACIECVAERYRYKGRIGQSSQSMNGATTSAYSLKDMQDYVKLMLQPYRRLVPV